MYILIETKNQYKGMNARPETRIKFEAILNYLKPTPSRVDLLDHIIDKYIEFEKIPIQQLVSLEEVKC